MTIKQQGGIFGRNPTFNDVTSSKSVVDNITIDGNTISTTNTNGALVLEPNGSAPVTINASQPRVRLVDTDASGTPEAEVSASGGDLILTADRDNEKSDTLIRFLIDGGEKWRINSTGNLVVSNSGNGIDFSATSGTGTSELFDDYEEGTWTPTTAGDATGALNGQQAGTYTKIGRFVHVQFQIDISTNFTSNKIGGLPYQPAIQSPISSLYGIFPVMSGSGTIFAGVSDLDTNVALFSDQVGTAHNPNTTSNIYRVALSYATA